MSTLARELVKNNIMKNNTPFYLEDRLKLLKANLEQGAFLFSTDEGRKAYFRSLLIEINQFILIMRDCLDLIHDNIQLFPRQSFYNTDFELINNSLLSWETENQEKPFWPPEIFTALDELRHLIQQANNDIDSPSVEQMQEIYLLRWTNFCNRKWPSMKSKVETQIIACLPLEPAARQQGLHHHIEKVLADLTNHPLGQQLAAQGITFDEYNHNGRLDDSVVAPNLFNCRHKLHNNTKVYEFFRLFMTYNMLQEELNKIHLDPVFEAQHELEDWFLDMAEKLQDEVKPDYTSRFNDLILELCHDPDLYECLKINTLRAPFNLKLAYNLFGLMISEKVFMTTAIDPLRSKLTSAKTNPYFTYSKYSDFESSFSEMNAHLLHVATDIIANWKSLIA